MTDHEHAATGPGPGSGPRPTPGAGPQAGADGRGGAPGPSGPSGPAAEADPPGPPHAFRRDRPHKMLAGVCAGLGRQCDMDPVIFRITLAVLSATGGIGLIFYGFAWLFVPYDDEDENEVRKLLTGRVDGQALAAVLFALVGCGVFLTMLRNGGVLTFAVVLSLLLAGAGYWSRQRGAPSPDPLAAQAAADAPPEPQAPPVLATSPSWWRDPIVKDGTHIGGTGYLWGPRDTRDLDVAAAVNIGLGTRPRARADIPAPHARPPKPRDHRWIGGWVFLLALLAGALGTSRTWDTHPLGASLQTGLACALAVFGLGIAVSAFLGRTGAGSILLAIITAGLLTASAAVPEDIGTQWNRTTWQPATAADVRERYDLGTGVGTLDLTRLDLTAGQTVTTRADVGVGRVRVLVPEDVTVRLSVDVGVGDLQLPGDDTKDVDVKPGRHQETTLSPAQGVKKSGTVDLDLHVGLGQAEVTRAAS
ncbi:PspC domain-containing protein [Streptomyces dubilierae]|uniref:PspC domain-containing protein n=1 Tax=Streptomyces dubilierae TaxID=3075533 RepID=A0ABU2P5F5_9ACTN|nr:PspC domain-containing protein [Streptomyces sp. DSM 41921]MDT0387383.1 PspC domain-containing protein [Streptomyces sp. DSM 41921]